MIFAMLRRLDDLAERVLFDVLLATRPRRVVALVGLIAASLVAVRVAHGPTLPSTASMATDVSVQDGGKLLFNRRWIDRLPKEYKDAFTMWVFTEDEIGQGMYFGGTLCGIPVKYMTELHGFQVRGDRLAFWFPADDSKLESGFKLTKEKNGQFDLKLVLAKDPRHGGKAHTYYSRMDGRLDAPQLAGVDLPRR